MCSSKAPVPNIEPDQDDGMRFAHAVALGQFADEVFRDLCERHGTTPEACGWSVELLTLAALDTAGLPN